jgi:hypothetical protein
MLRARNCWLASRAFFFGVSGTGLRTTLILYDPWFIVYLFYSLDTYMSISRAWSPRLPTSISLVSPFAGSRYLAMHLIICSSRQTPSEKSTIEESMDRSWICGLYILVWHIFCFIAFWATRPSRRSEFRLGLAQLVFEALYDTETKGFTMRSGLLS